jgi:endo-1,4-beta-xylanase
MIASLAALSLACAPDARNGSPAQETGGTTALSSHPAGSIPSLGGTSGTGGVMATGGTRSAVGGTNALGGYVVAGDGGTGGTGGAIGSGGVTGSGGTTGAGGGAGTVGGNGSGGSGSSGSGPGGSALGGGKAGAGGSGAATGGLATAGAGTAGAATGGQTAGGAGNGGAATGGLATGGAGTGGAATGGQTTGGAGTAGARTGGQTTGGAGTGGARTGGQTTSGAGTAGTGGATTGGATGACAVGTPLNGGTKYCASTTGTLSDGVGYSVWLSDSTTGTNCGTFYNVGAAFKAQWNMASGGDLLARAGLSWNSDKTYDQLGTISADYAYTKTGISNTNVYTGIYGWSVSPLVEFYIVEEWIGFNPGSNATKKGTFTVDGGTYDVYTHTQTNQPSIQGTATFQQFFSVRQSARQCGHISISAHFKEWASLGMTLGKMFEAKLLVEAMGGSGTIDFTSATVVAN